MTSPDYDIVIVGTGPAGLGAAFQLTDLSPSLSILMVDREKVCSGGLLNDCKQNYPTHRLRRRELTRRRPKAFPWWRSISAGHRESRTWNYQHGRTHRRPCLTSARPMRTDRQRLIQPPRPSSAGRAMEREAPTFDDAEARGSSSLAENMAGR
jgi:choline dehydrogenase-like flavoprotein